MFDFDNYKEIWQTISRNKSRSILTGFGVFWGVFMFIAMMGIGRGFENGFSQGIKGISPNSMVVFTGLTSIEYKGFNSGRSWDMDNSDVEMLRDNLPEIEYISGMVFTGADAPTTYGDKNGNYFVRGNNEEYYKIDPQPIVFGRFFNHIDVVEKRKVCIIGLKVYQELFDPDEDPIGKRIAVNGVYYSVVGVVNPSKNMNFGGDGASTIFIPSTTVQQVYNMGSDIHVVMFVAGDKVDIKKLEVKVKDLLKAKHNIAPNDEAAAQSFNLQQIFLMFRYLFLGINILVWIVGMGTLLAGVVGVSNIMLVSIRERTQEIGIKRALGAKPRVILLQIMSESVVLTFIAGFFGLFMGVLLLVGLDKFIGTKEMFADPFISFTLALIASLIILISGAIAGIIPARSALKVKAIDALRDE